VITVGANAMTKYKDPDRETRDVLNSESLAARAKLRQALSPRGDPRLSMAVSLT
jgi:hypothetical protein